MIEKMCSLHELYDCVEETIKIPKNPECISTMQEITSFFGRVRDKQPLMCNVTKVIKQQNEKLKNVCKYNPEFGSLLPAKKIEGFSH